MVLDSRRTGFIAGMLAPVLGFLAYGLIYTTAIRPMYDLAWFVNELFLGTLKYTSSILSLSLIANAFLFFWFDRRDAHRAMRGVIFAMLVYGAVIVFLVVVEKLIQWGIL